MNIAAHRRNTIAMDKAQSSYDAIEDPAYSKHWDEVREEEIKGEVTDDE